MEENIEQNNKQGADLSFPNSSYAIPSTVPCTQDLLDICSGKFTGSLQESTNSDDKITENYIEVVPVEDTDKRKSTDLDHDVIISQLLDEEEMENFKKKFDSSCISNSQKEVGRYSDGLDEEVKASGVLDSDDEDVDEMIVKKRKRKSKLTFSGNKLYFKLKDLLRIIFRR